MNEILEGDVLEVIKTLPDECVSCVITSPPYFGLRDYGADKQIGLEDTPEEFIAVMVDVFHEVKRVLKKDGTLWLNLGDTYAGGQQSGDKKFGNEAFNKNRPSREFTKTPKRKKPAKLKPKDLIGIPWRVALALQADGWYLRQDIIWNKPNPMPESVTDRCTKAHEYVFLLTKSPRYYFDSEAIKEPANYDGRQDTVMKGSQKYADGFVPNQPGQTMAVKGHERWKRKNDNTAYGGNGTGFQDHSGYSNIENPYVRNKRSVWTVTPKPFPDAHFATFPETLIEPMVLAGTSEEGNCAKCGASWERVVESTKVYDHVTTAAGKSKDGPYANQTGDGEGTHDIRHGVYSNSKTTGWKAGCDCNANRTPPIVLDPFMGSGTTAVVAKRLGRAYLGIELNPEYAQMARERIDGTTPPLFSQVGITDSAV